jgi:hypothetical protein
MFEPVGKTLDLARLARDADLVADFKAENLHLKFRIAELEAEIAAEREIPRSPCPTCGTIRKLSTETETFGFERYRFWFCSTCVKEEKHVLFFDTARRDDAKRRAEAEKRRKNTVLRFNH